MKRLIHGLSAGFDWTAQKSVWLGALMVVVIGLLTFADVIARYLLNSPLPGTYELVEVLMIPLGGIGIAYAAFTESHIAVDVLTNRFPTRVSTILIRAGLLLGLAVWGLIAYMGIPFITKLIELDTSVSSNLRQVPLAPFRIVFMLAIIMCGLICAKKAFGRICLDRSKEISTEDIEKGSL